MHEESITLVADGAYSGEKNFAVAKEHQIKLVTTNLTGKKPADIFAGFCSMTTGQSCYNVSMVSVPITSAMMKRMTGVMLIFLYPVVKDAL